MNSIQDDMRGFVSDIDDELKARGLRRRELGGTWSDAAALEARVVDLEKRCKLLEHHYAPMKPRAGDVPLVNLVDAAAVVGAAICEFCTHTALCGAGDPCADCNFYDWRQRGEPGTLPSRFELREELK